MPSSPITPGPLASPAACVNLDDHRFVRGLRFCDGASGGEPNRTPIDFFGPLVVRDQSITTYYIDAVAEFDQATGKVRRLLAPRRSDSTEFAARDGVAVVPRCDGVLVVHRDGCEVGQLPGHQVPPGVSAAEAIGGMHFVDDLLVSWGADGALRRWDVQQLRLLATAQLQSTDEARQTRLLAGSAGQLVLSRRDGAVVINSATFEVLARVGPFPLTSGWVPCGADRWVGISEDPQRRGLLFRGPAESDEQFVDTRDLPRSVAVSSGGVTATIVGPTLHLISRDGQVHRRSLTKGLYLTRRLSFSSNQTLLFAQDAEQGLHTIDPATGERVLSFEKR